MYREHQATIQAFAAESPVNLLQVGIFVQATINIHLEQVPRIMESVRAEGRESKYFSVYKRRAYDALVSEGEGFAYDGSAVSQGVRR